MIEIINAPPIPGLHFRHFQGQRDYAQIAAVLAASQAADHVTRNVSADNIADAYQHLINCDPFKDIIVAEVLDKLLGMRVVGGKVMEIPDTYIIIMVSLFQSGGGKVLVRLCCSGWKTISLN